jgi:methionyl-tRNA synthetase
MSCEWTLCNLNQKNEVVSFVRGGLQDLSVSRLRDFVS